MPKPRKGQLPLRLRKNAKTAVRAQFAALCYRVVDGKVWVCLVTSRGTGRWILPKGWPMHKQTPAAAAATEAFEEAGVSGHAFDRCLGVYHYTKPLAQRPTPVLTMVYPVRVDTEHDTWPEQHQRRRKWFKLKKAATKVDEPSLREIILSFDPKLLAQD